MVKLFIEMGDVRKGIGLVLFVWGWKREGGEGKG